MATATTTKGKAEASEGIPIRKLDSFPEWQEADARLTSVKTELGQVESRISAILSRTAQEPLGGDALENAAARRLATGAHAAPECKTELTAEDLELKELKSRQRILTRAIFSGQRELQAIVRKASKEICRPLVPMHKQRVRAIAKAAAVLAHAVKAETELREALEAEGVLIGVSICPMPFLSSFLDLAEESSIVRRYFAEAVALDMLTQNETDALVRG